MLNISERRFGGAPIVLEVRHGDPLLRAGVLAALREDGRFRVQSGDQPALPGALEADVLVTDYDAGIALAESRGRRHADLRVMIVTQRDGETDVRYALSRGVLGYVVIGCRLDEIADCALAVQRGQRYLTQAAAVRIAEQLLYPSLTPRELDVLRCVAGGWTNKRVGNHLGVALGTVKAHLKAIFGKLEARTRTEAVHIAQRRGLLLAVQVPVSSRPPAPSPAPSAQRVAPVRDFAHDQPVARHQVRPAGRPHPFAQALAARVEENFDGERDPQSCPVT